MVQYKESSQFFDLGILVDMFDYVWHSGLNKKIYPQICIINNIFRKLRTKVENVDIVGYLYERFVS